MPDMWWGFGAIGYSMAVVCVLDAQLTDHLSNTFRQTQHFFSPHSRAMWWGPLAPVCVETPMGTKPSLEKDSQHIVA